MGFAAVRADRKDSGPLIGAAVYEHRESASSVEIGFTWDWGGVAADAVIQMEILAAAARVFRTSGLHARGN